MRRAVSRRFTLRWHGDQIGSLLGVGTVAGLQDAADLLLDAARQRVPIESMELKQSAVRSVDPAARKAAVSFDTPYAVRQHEIFRYRHDAGRTAKYLERPFGENHGEFARLIAAAVRRHWGI